VEKDRDVSWSAPNSWVILPATLWDLGALYCLERLCFAQDAWPVTDLIAVLTMPGVVRLKAIWRRRMIGFIAGDPRPSEGIAWIATLGVHPDFRRQGIGRALLRACEQQLRLPRIRLTVRRSNEAAISLYEEEGYRIVSSIPAYYRDGEMAWVMEKELFK
jgi:ribosomal protein S18 acetylase RimI-like enzyme